MSFTVPDVFSETLEADPTALRIVKAAKTESDLYTNPYIQINYTEPSTTMVPPSKELYTDGQDMEAFAAGPYTWNGFSATSLDKPLIVVWTVDSEEQFQAAV